MNQLSKTNVTMWKNRDAAVDKKLRKTNTSKIRTSSKKLEESSKIENDFIENLKKQIYFMEMELKLMKEREREIAKSGGFTQLFNDDKDPQIHIQQLKVKYANMRKKMEDEIVKLKEQQRKVRGINVALKAKLESLQKSEQEVYKKLKNIESVKNSELNEKNNNFFQKDNERTNLEADNRLQNTKLRETVNNNEELKYTIETEDKIGKMKQEKLIRSLNKEIEILKGGPNLNDPEALNYLAETYQAMKESLLKASQQSQNNRKRNAKKNSYKNK